MRVAMMRCCHRDITRLVRPGYRVVASLSQYRCRVLVVTHCESIVASGGSPAEVATHGPRIAANNSLDRVNVFWCGSSGQRFLAKNRPKSPLSRRPPEKNRPEQLSAGPSKNGTARIAKTRPAHSGLFFGAHRTFREKWISAGDLALATIRHARRLVQGSPRRYIPGRPFPICLIVA